MADREINQLIRAYLMSRYSITNQDVTTLVRRYLDENPSGLVERTVVYQALVTAAQA